MPVTPSPPVSVLRDQSRVVFAGLAGILGRRIGESHVDAVPPTDAAVGAPGLAVELTQGVAPGPTGEGLDPLRLASRNA
jgi:hypothetical protein